MIPRPHRYSLFPYTTLFRSWKGDGRRGRAGRGNQEDHADLLARIERREIKVPDAARSVGLNESTLRYWLLKRKQQGNAEAVEPLPQARRFQPNADQRKMLDRLLEPFEAIPGHNRQDKQINDATIRPVLEAIKAGKIRVSHVQHHNNGMNPSVLKRWSDQLKIPIRSKKK